jgi:hypothetical protein
VKNAGLRLTTSDRMGIVGCSEELTGGEG